MSCLFPFDMFSFTLVIFPIIFTIMFVFIIGTFIVVAIKGIGEWSSNNKQAILKVAGKLVSRRTKVSGGHNSANNNMNSSSTTYYATFEVESGDRIEFNVGGKEYGLLAEGDIGKLTFQGTRYHSFERVVEKDEE